MVYRISMSFPAGGSGNGLKGAVAFALIVDVPFLAIVLLGGRTVTATLLILPIALSALIIYSSYAAGRMKYILDEDGVRVSFPLSPLRVSYGKIKSAGKVETTLSFRLFGGSLPGAHGEIHNQSW